MICPQGCENLQVQCLHTYAKGILNKTLLACPMAGHEGSGCQAKIRYEDYMSHVIQNCGELMAKCECGKLVKQNLIKKHKTDECELTIVQCSSCKMMMPRG